MAGPHGSGECRAGQAGFADYDAGGTGSLRGPLLFSTSLEHLEGKLSLLDIECFGPASVLVEYRHLDELVGAALTLEPSLTATVHATSDEEQWAQRLFGVLESRAGRLISEGLSNT